MVCTSHDRKEAENVFSLFKSYDFVLFGEKSCLQLVKQYEI